MTSGFLQFFISICDFTLPECWLQINLTGSMTKKLLRPFENESIVRIFHVSCMVRPNNKNI